MAQKYFGKGIPVAAGFDLGSQAPLDARTVVTAYSDLATIPDIQKYKGLEVYVEAEDKKYRWNGTTWVDTATSGATGADGKAATIKVGTVTTGEAGTQASVTNAGTENAAVFNFTIPKGAKGDKGDTGEKGDTGATGPQGPQGEPFQVAKIYESISAMNAGYATDEVKVGQFIIINTGNVEDEDNAKLYVKGESAYEFITDLSGAQGVKGPQGPTGATGSPGAKGDKGDDGAAATIQVGTVTTGEAGTEASVTNAGTANAARFNFVIPKGEKGETGEKGDAGAKGDTGEKGEKGDTGATGTRGSAWYTGSGITGTSTAETVFSGSGVTSALVNDMYLNPSTGNVYKCTVAGAASVAKWVYTGTIKGATGSQGPKGDTGEKGEKGDTGAAGADGDSIKVGDTYETATERTLFFKTI